MQLIAKSLNDLRHVQTNVRLSQSEILDAEYKALCARTEQRQRAAKADLARRGVHPRVAIGSGYVPHYIAKHFLHVKVS
jgi:hypothetical protein